jgi:hypothetical protein
MVYMSSEVALNGTYYKGYLGLARVKLSRGSFVRIAIAFILKSLMGAQHG